MVVRVRQHVNPLAARFRSPVPAPLWETVFAVPERSLHLDIGCGRGRFLRQMAEQHLDWNFLGLEIREPLVVQANLTRHELALTNLHYLFCNVNNSLHPLLRSLPAGVLHYVTIQFPDPWFKKRHQKRRVVQPEMVETIARYLVTGGQVLVQSDVEAVAVEMDDRFQAHDAFQRSHLGWLATNPLPVPTEREVATLEKGEPVYRALFTRQGAIA